MLKIITALLNLNLALGFFQSTFTAMKNALVSRDQFAFFRTTLAQLVDKSIHTCAT